MGELEDGSAAAALKLEGNKMFGARRYADARAKYTNALALNPTPALHTNRALCFLKEGKTRKALGECDAAIKLDSSWERGYERKAEALCVLHKFSEAQGVINEGLKRVPHSAGLKKALGRIQVRNHLAQQTTSYEVRSNEQSRTLLARAATSHMRHELTPAEQCVFEKFMKVYERTTRRAIAQENLGDVAGAVKLFEAGAAVGCTTAMCALGRIFIFGQGVVVDTERGAMWLNKCIEHGPAPNACVFKDRYDPALDSAKGLLGQAHRHGWGVSKDEAVAERWLREAAKGGDLVSQNNLGSLLADRVGGDMEESLRWYQSSAEAGYPLAMTNLGHMLAHGVGCDLDLAAAETWFRKAISYNEATACAKLALLVTSRDGDDAAALWQQAIDFQTKHAGAFRPATAMQAFWCLMRQQEQRDNALSVQELKTQLSELNIELPPQTAESWEQHQSYRLSLVSSLRAARPLTENEKQAIVFGEKAAHTDGECACALGEFWLGRGECKRAMGTFISGAKLANAEAACHAGKLFLGKEPERDLKRAAKYFRQAAQVRLFYGGP